MPTKKELEAIIEGLGFDPSTPLEDYVKLGSFIYPKDAAVTLKWEGEYCEFKRADLLLNPRELVVYFIVADT